MSSGLFDEVAALVRDVIGEDFLLDQQITPDTAACHLEKLL